MRRRATKPSALLRLVAVCLLAALAGCARVTADVRVSSQGAIDGTYVMAFSEQVAADLGSSPEALLEMLRGEESAEDALPGMVEQPYDRDGYAGVEFVLTDVDLEDFNRWSDIEMSDETGFTIEPVDGTYVLTGQMVYPDRDELLWEPPPDAGDLELRISVTFPGRVLQSDGQVEGNTVTWYGEPGQTIEMNARADAQPRMSPWAWWVIGGAVVVVGAGVAGAIVTLRRRTSAGPAGPPPPPTEMSVPVSPHHGD